MSQEARHVVAIVGGAVAGSEAARVFADRGAEVIVIEQNPRPYGKIEDGLPRWHDALARRDGSGRLEVLTGLEDFREHLGGEITVTLLEGVGTAVEVNEVDLETMAECVKWLQAKYATTAA